MATSTTHKAVSKKPMIKNGLTLVWLDDTAVEDPNAKSMFLTLFEQVFAFADTGACLELVESAEGKIDCISILVSGSYGQMIVPNRLQPLLQVKDIYVFCFNIPKHTEWASKCDKVRCVESDFEKIINRMQKDLKLFIEQPEEQVQPLVQEEEEVEEEEEEGMIPQEKERFTDDNNLYDHLALNLLLQTTDDKDGEEDFIKYCEENQQENLFRQDVSIKDWYKQDLSFLQLNSTDYNQLWKLRWFIRIFYKQLNHEYKELLKEETIFRSNYGTWLSSDELDGMKHRISKTIIFTDTLLTYRNREKALESIENKSTDEKKHRVIFEINVNTKILPTNPYGQIDKDQILFWFGSRYRIMKIELVEENANDLNSYWIIGLNLSSAFNTNDSIQNLYNYYFKNLTELNNLYQTLGRILIYKGSYNQAEQWLTIGNHYEELSEIAIRRYHLEQAEQYLKNLSEDSNDANLLRAYVNLLTSSEHAARGRTILMKICSEATDRIVRAKANIALGFINLIVTKQIDQALDYFKIGNETLSKHLPDIHPDVAKSYLGIGYAYFMQGNFIESEKAFQTAFQIQKQSIISNHPDFAKTRNGLAHCLGVKKQTIEQAFKEFDYAYEILKQTFSPEYKTHPEIILTKNDMKILRKGKDLQARNLLLDYI